MKKGLVIFVGGKLLVSTKLVDAGFSFLGILVNNNDYAEPLISWSGTNASIFGTGLISRLRR